VVQNGPLSSFPRAAHNCATNRRHGPGTATRAAAPPLRNAETEGRFRMLMFKRAQLYIALGLAALAELIVRAAVR